MATSNDIAVVGWAQTPDGPPHRQVRDPAAARRHHRRARRRSASPGPTSTSPASAAATTSPARRSRSCTNLDAIGAWPPKRDSHVEMDGAWALYEAWLRLQEGDIEIAVVTGSGRSSTGDPALIYPMEMDPYYLAPLGADPLTFAALQARAVIAAGIADERSMAEVAVRRPGQGRRVDALLAERLRARAAAPPRRAADHRRRRRHGARHRRPGPPAGRAAGLHHRLRPPHRVPQPVVPRPRRLAVDPHRRRGRRPGRRARSRSPSCRRPSPTRSCCCARCSASATTSTVNPSGGALTANPIMATGLVPHRLRRRPHLRRRHPGARPLDVAARACNRTSSASWRAIVSHQPCAIVGVGQTHHKSRRRDVSLRRPRPRGRRSAPSTTPT